MIIHFYDFIKLKDIDLEAKFEAFQKTYENDRTKQVGITLLIGEIVAI